ncbi:TetR/AcrR family transcriptional regulator [Solibacillus silvestris]|uniref:TetR/AcrR family transcriptional regulator n=1 Tax=Solibacillus silvestris TaxID=76853 RepID=UPI003F80B9D5
MNKREQKKLERRTNIIQAAKELILKDGIQQVQLQDVAKKVGIGIATLYRYFANKELLVLAVNNEITNEMTASIEAIAGESDTAYEQIERILTYYMDLSNDPQHQFIKFFKAFEAYKPMSKDSYEFEEFMKARREMANVLINIAAKGREDLSIRSDIDVNLYILTVVQNMSHFTVESSLTVHDPALPVELLPEKQLGLLKEMFLQYIRADN